MSNDLISREALRNVILNDSKLDGANANWEVNRILVHIDNAPTVIPDIEEFDKALHKWFEEIDEWEKKNGKIRPQGEWKHHEEYTNNRTFYITECPFCKLRVQEETNFCPNCGLPMKKGGTEE